MGASQVLQAPRSWDRLLRASGVLLALSILWFLVNAVHPVGPPVLLWLPTPLGAAVVVAIGLRTSRTMTLNTPTRRFWRHVSIVASLVGAGAAVQAVDVLAYPNAGGPHIPPAMIAFDGPAVLIVVYALFRLPLARQTAGELLRLLLDAGTLVLAAAVFLWHFQTRQLLGGNDLGLVGSLVLTLLALVAVFAVAKVVLNSYTVIDNGALRLLALAMILGVVFPMAQPYLAAVRPHLFSVMVGVPAVFFVGALAGERQRLAEQGLRRGVAAPRRRSFSLLPYAAVAAVDGLLVSVTWGDDPGDAKIVVSSVVILTALVVLRQITAFRDNARLLGQLDHGANHDTLTQLPNRFLFHKRLQRALTASGTRNVSVALIDLDDFKEVNDTLGHEVGDLLLIAVAQRLNDCVRAEDTVARLGGDEFVVVLDGADPAAADLAAERMIDALRQPVLADGHELPIRASIGIADGHTGDEASVLLRHADIAMYAAKNISGTAYLHYDAGMATAGTDHAHLGVELREAIEAEQLFLLYQPIVSLDDGRVLGAEALVRWAHPTHGTLPPDTFIPVAERTGLIVPLGRWVMRSAFRQLAAWLAEHGAAAPGVLNVNVSARDLREPGFAAGVGALLAEYAIAADRVTLEITETMALEPGQSVTTLHQLRALGVRISLDDFGTGHSTLALLHDCPIDEIKLDRSFTQAEVDGRVPMAAAVIHLAQALGLHAVAEGVETREQADQLLSLGYTAAQGYHFARPMPADKLGALLAAGEFLMPEPAAV
jgi:diguanylate cyclase (GGDEF)-like protein